MTTHSAKDAYELVIENGGATSPRRDEVDSRIVEEVLSGTGQIINSQNDVGGWPEYRSGESPADDDRDGIADAWEGEHGLDPKDGSDQSQDRNGDGYTNLEEYLNSVIKTAARS
jgi:hypothetical protein